MSPELEYGASMVRWEEPDTCVLSLIGDIDGDEMRRISRMHRAFSLGKKNVLGLVDVSQLTSFSAEARKAAREGGEGIHVRGTAIYGASRQYQIIGAILMRGIDLFYKRADRPVRFFSTEEEARAWLSERRRVLCTEERTGAEVLV